MFGAKILPEWGIDLANLFQAQRTGGLGQKTIPVKVLGLYYNRPL